MSEGEGAGAGDSPPRPALSADATRALRLRAQLLTGPRGPDVEAVVSALGAVQAQDARFARLAIRPRSTGLDAGTVDHARYEQRSVVCTWALRGTLHLVAARDVRWMVDLLGPIFAAAGRRRRHALGLDDDLCDRAVSSMREILAEEGPLVRCELVRRLAGRGMAIDGGGQAPAHLVAYAAMRGAICRGPLGADQGDPTYVLLDDWVGPQPMLDPDEALAELARRHLGGHGPAAAGDLAAWSGIGLRRARRALDLIGAELTRVDGADGSAWMLASTAAGELRPTHHPQVALLGHFDPYLLGYASRELVLEPCFAVRIQAGGGFIRPALLVDGRVAGTWRARRSAGRLTVEPEPFGELSDDVLAALRGEVADLGRFLGLEAVLDATADLRRTS